MEKYVSSMTCADFIVSTPDHLRQPADEFITPEQIEVIAATQGHLPARDMLCEKMHTVMTEDALRAGLCKVRKRRAA